MGDTSSSFSISNYFDRFIVALVAGLLLPEEDSPIRVALVDEDRTKETILFSGLLEETASHNQFIQIMSITKDNAEKLMEKNEISTYFTFPRGFTEDLYEGESVTIPIVGNPARPTDSFLVKELVESMMRYIAAAQSTILTINEYAKKTDMPKEERQKMMFQQFMDFSLYTLGKDKLLDEEVITNVATSSPTHYYILSGWLIIYVSLAFRYLYCFRERRAFLDAHSDEIIRCYHVATYPSKNSCLFRI